MSISNSSELGLMILCANLKRREDRRFVMKHALQSVCEIPIEFFEAIDGRCVPQSKLSRFPEDATQSSYAVRLTKRLALRKFLKSENRFLLYLEDDIVVVEEFDETVLEGMERGHEMLFLGGGHHEPPEGEGKWRKCRKTYNNHALLFSREGARKALKVLAGWQKGWSDREFQLAMSDGRIEAWCVTPWVAFQRVTRSDNYGNGDCVSLAEGPQPFMLGDDLAVLDTALNFSKVVVEFGSGASTLHLGRRLKDWGRLVSIEHNREWYENVSEALAALQYPVEYVLSEPRPLRPTDGPQQFLPGQLDAYVEAARPFVSEGEADLVFVDGRERIRCALEAVHFLKSGGLLMIHDFWPRQHYRARLGELLQHYDYVLESPTQEGKNGQGMVVFRKKEA